MARMLNGADYRRYVEIAFRHTNDWMLTPRSMESYLQHRLYLIENQIERLAEDLEGYPFASYPTEAPEETLPEEIWASWTSLNYLLRARNSLQGALSRMQRRAN